MQYSYSKNGNVESIAALIDGELCQATSDHPAWDTIKANCFDGTLTLADFDLGQKVIEYMKLSEFVTVADGELFYGDEPMYGLLADKILSSLKAGDEAQPLVLFAEHLAENPSRNSRDQLFQWLDKAGLQLDDDGFVIGYKSVVSSGSQFKSVSAGTAWVNGTKHVGNIPQTVGDYVAMPRHEVTDNPSVACSYGLHVGTLKYATNFTGDVILEVHVNPRDVVSVPMDSGFEKMRVCEYYVAGIYNPDETKSYEFQDSSFLQRVLWSDDGDGYGPLTVKMRNGKEYTYLSVGEEEYDAFVLSDILGTSGCVYGIIKTDYELL